MPYRYASRDTVRLSKEDMFKQIKERRNLDSVSLFGTPKFERITDTMLENLSYESYTWSRGDRFYKLAHTFYGDAAYWWVIAMFNNSPTEHHIKIGEEIIIPLEMDSVASLMGVV